MKKFGAFGAMGLAAILPAFFATACSSSDRRASQNSQEISASGRLNLPLTATAPSGVTYRLRRATFRVSGAASATLRGDDRPRDSALAKDLPAGDYLVRLDAGWSLQRQNADGTFEQVRAALETRRRWD